MCFAIWAESLLLRKRGLDICVFFHAFAESARHGFPTDLYLSIAMHEKCVEAPLSSLLQAYAVMWLPVSQPLGAEFAALLSSVKTLLSFYGTAKAVYVNMQLDLRRHLYALEDSQSDARRRLRSPRRQPQPGPGYRPGLGHEATARPPLGALASVGGPRCPPGVAVHPPGGPWPPPGIAGHPPGTWNLLRPDFLRVVGSGDGCRLQGCCCVVDLLCLFWGAVCAEGSREGRKE